MNYKSEVSRDELIELFKSMLSLSIFCSKWGTCEKCILAPKDPKEDCVLRSSPPSNYSLTPQYQALKTIVELKDSDEDSCMNCENSHDCTLEAELHKLDFGNSVCERYKRKSDV